MRRQSRRTDYQLSRVSVERLDAVVTRRKAPGTTGAENRPKDSFAFFFFFFVVVFFVFFFFVVFFVFFFFFVVVVVSASSSSSSFSSSSSSSSSCHHDHHTHQHHLRYHHLCPFGGCSSLQYSMTLDNDTGLSRNCS